MYRCQLCKQVVPTKTKAHRLVIETRPRCYPARRQVHRVTYYGRVKHNDDPGGEGYETVREVIACPACAAQLEQKALSR